MRLLNLFSCLFLFFVAQLSAQSELKIRLSHAQDRKASEILVLNYPDIKPTVINDTMAIYTLTLPLPEYISLLISKDQHLYKALWIYPRTPAEVLVDASDNTMKIKNPSIWDTFTNTWGNLFKHNQAAADSVASRYILENPGSYLSLWLLDHGVARQDRNLKIKLFHLLGPELASYKEYSVLSADLRGRRYPKPGEAFKEFSLEDENGKMYGTKNTAHKSVLLHFWSDNCAPCIKGMNELVTFYKTLDSSKTQMISINMDDDKTQWNTSETKRIIQWPCLWQQGGLYGPLCLHYNLTAMPFFVLFDKEKKLHVIIEGEDLYSLRKELKSLDN